MTRRTLEERIASAARDLGQLEARRLFKDLTRGARAKTKARRLELRRRFELGGAVVAAGCGDWLVPEIVGLLLDGVERIGDSPTQRLGMKQRGELHLSRRTSQRQKRIQPTGES
ncbi:conjugal transfer protein TraD [Tahibacter soli]|uniref:Conjugal transfer protein TraD n=1 Tax=Tahibacter soli TaxID=2983605 RepID=A0A9X3YFW2_9GAMM|nr:conjugal transfer protein TraD [Tahibacter soli]MDC8010954.1 conjugal transfer protein TraD [Tahibacter soli]